VLKNIDWWHCNFSRTIASCDCIILFVLCCWLVFLHKNVVVCFWSWLVVKSLWSVYRAWCEASADSAEYSYQLRYELGDKHSQRPTVKTAVSCYYWQYPLSFTSAHWTAIQRSLSVNSVAYKLLHFANSVKLKNYLYIAAKFNCTDLAAAQVNIVHCRFSLTALNWFSILYFWH